MAEPRKAKRPPRPRANAKPRRPEAPAEATPTSLFDGLTPDRLRHHWALHHPDRPEIRAGLERLYRQS